MALRRGFLRATLPLARTDALKLRNRLGLPACRCVAHGGTAAPTAAAPCPCTAATGAGVSAACPHATMRHVRIRQHPVSGLYFLPVDDRAFSVLDALERADCQDVDDAPLASVAEQD